MPITPFNPVKHGFHFSNNNIEWKVLIFKQVALCGGMSYAAIDFYTYNIAVPPIKDAPALLTPLNAYILARQWKAHENTATRFLGAWVPLLGPILTPVTINNDQEYAKLQSLLRGGRPIPICVVGNGYGHHVVAHACNDTGPKLIKVYDPNQPDVLAQITQPAWNQIKISNSSKWYHSFFVDDGYHYNKPDVLQAEGNWRWCTKCQGLFHYDSGPHGVCPKGGPHEKGGVYHYTLQLQTSGAWKKCAFCDALFNFKSTSRCPVGGAHIANDNNIYDLSVASYGQEETNWFQCGRCRGMFWAGTSLGTCPAGGGHQKYTPFTLTRTEFLTER